LPRIEPDRFETHLFTIELSSRIERIAIELVTPSRGGRQATAGAIAGPVANFYVRTLHFEDLACCGCTRQDPRAFGDLAGYIERGEIRPLVFRVCPLCEIVAAQQTLLDKNLLGSWRWIFPGKSRFRQSITAIRHREN